MPLPYAIAGCLAVMAASLGVGLAVQRHAQHLTEMLGMMVGMTLGMMTGLAAGAWLGLATDMFVSNTLAILIGLGFGAGFGRLGGLMGVLEGGMGGVMGGMMGAMLGVMVRLSPLAIWGTAALMTLLLLLSLAGLYRLVQTRCARPAAIDPVCGMSVDPATAPASAVYREQRFYFCAPACRRAFEKDPERYRQPAGSRSADAALVSRQA